MCSVKLLAYLIWIYIFGVKQISSWNLNHTNYSEGKRISRQLRAAGTGAACILPPQPSPGSWSVVDETSDFSPGTLVPHRTILRISCPETYKLDGANITVCVNGGWSDGIGQCLKTCEPLYSTTIMTVSCVFNEKKVKDCVNALDGTIARFKCATFYEENRGLGIRPAYCLRGKWSHNPPECVPVCGQKSVNEDPTLIVSGTAVNKGDYPWQVALYTIDDKVLQCGGSLLNERVILTAAHCITNNQGKLHPKERYVVAVGKYFRKFNDARDFNESQFSEIHDMLIPKQYKGPTQNFFGDIAMIVAKKTFTLSERVQPVCVDWEAKYENSLFLNPSRLQKGYVTGWGYTVEYKNPSDVLKELSVPLINYDQCSATLPEEYQTYMTDDKLCAGYLRNGTSVCQGDSGGGLVFKYGKRYYIVGIVSLAPQAPTEVGGCDSQQYGLYTQVSYYIDKFILHNEARYKPSLSENEDCLNGVCEDATTVTTELVPRATETKLSEKNNFKPCDGYEIFTCKSGNYCISIEQQCDGRVDCPDGSDENDCHTVRCPGYYFRCQYGGCINAELECDGKIDCRDGSDENTPKCKKSLSQCRDYQFRCNSGKCIEPISKCDGRADCDDNSDETKETCSKIRCSRFNFRCKYGACVTASTECDGIKHCFDGSDEDPILCGNKTTSIPKTGDCVLPEHPAFGKWSVYGTPVGVFTPNMSVNSGTVLRIQCQKQYLLDGIDAVFCENSLWTPRIGQCLKTCPPIMTTESMNVTCIERDREVENCSKAINGTLARFQCAPFYEDLGLKRHPARICLDGNWDRKPPECAPVCGLMPTENGTAKKNINDPWQVAVYIGKPAKKLVCIGSLINQKVVLTAAHCVSNPEGRLEPTENFTVGVGKHYKQFFDSRDTDPQFSEVEEIFTPVRYRGDLQNYVGDIAILVAKSSFTLSAKVLPVCVDWGANYEAELLDNTKEPAYVVTWNSSNSNERGFDELKKQETAIVDKQTCVRDVPGNYQPFLTFDKFCGSTKKDGTPFRGLTSTLVKKHRDSGRYYIVGIASIATKDISPEYIFFTDIAKYIDFLLEKEFLFRPSTSNKNSDNEPTGNVLPTTQQPEVPQRGCTLPPYPDFGSWKIFESNSTALPGGMVNAGILLSVTCRKGYQLDGTRYIFCYNNKWSPEIGKCLSVCPPLSNTTTTTVTCMFNNKLTNCENPVVGTTAKFKCVDYYENPLLTQQYYEKNQASPICEDGTWSQPVIRCQPVCGKKSITSRPVPNQIVIDTAKGEYPWQVAIYSGARKRFVCSGSLLNPRMILTAAQCVTTEKGSVKSMDQFTVAAGKCYRKYNDTRDTPHSQFSDLSHIYIPNEYKGATSNYIGDIALLITTKPFTLSETVQPVCVDWRGLYENQLNTNTTVTGYVAGWGFTVNKTKPSGELKELSVPIVTQEKCSAGLPENVQNFITNDKLCAGYVNDTSVCKNSKGGGLVLEHGGRYYLTGILSIASDDKNCENQLYGLYTKVSRYVDNFIMPHQALN